MRVIEVYRVGAAVLAVQPESVGLLGTKSVFSQLVPSDYISMVINVLETKMKPLVLSTNTIKTPIGRIVIAIDHENRVRAVEFEDLIERMHRLLRIHYGDGGVNLVKNNTLMQAARQIQRYFDGDLSALSNIEVATAGTPFQQVVWSALRQIKPGMTSSYGSLATRIGRPTAARAVGLANGTNPIPIIVPCHRVIGADGSMTGYGGGLARKRWLLAHEHALPQTAAN